MELPGGTAPDQTTGLRQQQYRTEATPTSRPPRRQSATAAGSICRPRRAAASAPQPHRRTRVQTKPIPRICPHSCFGRYHLKLSLIKFTRRRADLRLPVLHRYLLILIGMFATDRLARGQLFCLRWRALMGEPHDDYQRTLAFAEIALGQLRALPSRHRRAISKSGTTTPPATIPRSTAPSIKRSRKRAISAEPISIRSTTRTLSPLALGTDRHVGSRVPDEIKQVLEMIDAASGSATPIRKSRRRVREASPAPPTATRCAP